jgi:hypothetical protein
MRDLTANKEPLLFSNTNLMPAIVINWSPKTILYDPHPATDVEYVAQMPFHQLNSNKVRSLGRIKMSTEHHQTICLRCFYLNSRRKLQELNNTK